MGQSHRPMEHFTNGVVIENPIRHEPQQSKSQQHQSENHQRNLLFNETKNNTLLCGDFTDLDKISESNPIEGEDQDEHTIGVAAAGENQLNRDMTLSPLSECTIYDNKDGEMASNAIEISESKAITTTMQATVTTVKQNVGKTQNDNNNTIKPRVATVSAVNTTAALEEVNFDHLHNNETHFDRRMLKLIEGKLQATRSATSFSKT